MVDTIRLILFLDCNLACPYCCNRQEQFYSKFQYKKFTDIDFSTYKNVCITGGEPFLRKGVLFTFLSKIPKAKNIYLYTNGMLITNSDIVRLCQFKNIRGLNIGLHSEYQIDLVNPLIDHLFSVRYTVEKSLVSNLLKRCRNRLTLLNLKGWTMNDCSMPNEDWVLLHQ